MTALAWITFGVALGGIVHAWWGRWIHNREISRERYRMFKGHL